MKLMSDQVRKLDEEWIELIMTARKLGLTVEEIRAFLQKQKSTHQQSYAN